MEHKLRIESGQSLSSGRHLHKADHILTYFLVVDHDRQKHLMVENVLIYNYGEDTYETNLPIHSKYIYLFEW